ncbi:hypothetical protein [Moorella sp. E306M]|uniref:hypothetical protein n=1 Tax=Moorella sp. E306M TaxID=2572683 RepID=UPI0010FFBF8C|nr:hypothetical protein [Moorella sp. E306M]GEA17721.1 hypothetical protein E306M_08550 [Moorella sp. E306M]GEA17790.1 hypothetical protein E306M_09240 [Moorella sp. E306M]
MRQWDLDKVDKWVDEVALLPIAKFYPSAVAKDVGLPVQEVFIKLQELVNQKKLICIWEVRCPECLVTINELTSLDLSKASICYLCGDEIITSPEIVFPAFKINPQYKAYIKESAKKKHPGEPKKIFGAYSRNRKLYHCHS